MDPQQRLLLETAGRRWSGPGSAGVPSTGRHRGVRGLDGRGLRASRMADLAAGRLRCWGRDGEQRAAGRLSYVLGLRGAGDDGGHGVLVVAGGAAPGGGRRCGRGSATLALAGGVQVMLTPTIVRGVQPAAGAWRRTGAARASRRRRTAGWARGLRGGGAQAAVGRAARRGPRAGGDPRAAVNQDGRSQGLTAPNGPAQERVIRRALAVAGVVPADIDAVEATGRGRARRPDRGGGAGGGVRAGGSADGRCGSGRRSRTSGTRRRRPGSLGVMKMVLALQHGVLPPTLHAEHPSPHIAWERERRCAGAGGAGVAAATGPCAAGGGVVVRAQRDQCACGDRGGAGARRSWRCWCRRSSAAALRAQAAAAGEWLGRASGGAGGRTWRSAAGDRADALEHRLAVGRARRAAGGARGVADGRAAPTVRRVARRRRAGWRCCSPGRAVSGPGMGRGLHAAWRGVPRGVRRAVRGVRRGSSTGRCAR
jgi:hypothetical protein